MKKENKYLELSGIIGQWVGMAIIICGILAEISLGAHLGFVLITGGSLVWAIATKFRGK